MASQGLSCNFKQIHSRTLAAQYQGGHCYIKVIYQERNKASGISYSQESNRPSRSIVPQSSYLTAEFQLYSTPWGNYLFFNFSADPLENYIQYTYTKIQKCGKNECNLVSLAPYLAYFGYGDITPRSNVYSKRNSLAIYFQFPFNEEITITIIREMGKGLKCFFS